MEMLQQQVQDRKENLEGTNSILIQGLSYLPGWTEKNFQVPQHATCSITEHSSSLLDAVAPFLPFCRHISISCCYACHYQISALSCPEECSVAAPVSALIKLPLRCLMLQVLGKVFETVALLATESSRLSKKDAFTAITGLVDKMSDIKLKGPAGEALTAMSEALGPQFVFTQLHKRAAAQKNPKVRLSHSLASKITRAGRLHLV